MSVSVVECAVWVVRWVAESNILVCPITITSLGCLWTFPTVV